MLAAIGLAAGGGGKKAPVRTASVPTAGQPAPSARSGGAARPASRARSRSTPIRVVARRVEAIRGLRFRSIPRGHEVTPAQAARAGLADFDRSYPPARRRADEALLERLGLLPREDSLRREIGTVFRDQVGGYYDPRTKGLAIVKGGSTAGALGDVVLAHELNHALEDQRFELHDSGSEAAIDDGSLADTALVEGSATAVMFAYARRFLDPGRALGDLLPALQSSAAGSGLPRYLEDSLTWPYEGGQAFVDRLYGRLHGWALVDYALRRRRPDSTEQVLHPDKYLADEPPLPVHGPPGPGAGWRPVEHGTLGEWDTLELLRLANASQADAAAAGWGGGRYALWSRGAAHAAVLSWRWDTRRDAVQAARALPAYRAYAGRRGPAALAARGDATAIGLAPSAPLAQRVADASVSPLGR